MLTSWTKRVTVDFIRSVLDRYLLCQKHHGALGGAVGGSARLEADETEHAGCVDDPAAVARGVGLLPQELRDGVLGAEKDGAGVDFPRQEEGGRRLACWVVAWIPGVGDVESEEDVRTLQSPRSPRSCRGLCLRFRSRLCRRF
jgi:hypothetical protein